MKFCMRYSQFDRKLNGFGTVYLDIPMKLCKRTKKNNATLYNDPKLCPKCKKELRNMSRLMMAFLSWTCDHCDKNWYQRGEELYKY